MSQTDMNVANGSGAVVRADINAHFEAIITNSSGATAPTTTFADMWWYDTSTNILKRRNNANTAWISVMDGTTGLFTGVATGNVPTVNQAETSTASATATTLGTTLKHLITGTTTITSFAGVAGVTYHCTAGGAFLLTHNATNLDILQTGANITTAADDTFDVYMRTTTTAEIRNYQRADGTALVGSVGSLVQQVYTQTGAVATGTTTIPDDDTIPQNTEGDEYMTLAITPTSATNILEIDSVVYFASAGGGRVKVCIFQDTTADALAVGGGPIVVNGVLQTAVVSHTMVAGTTSATTFKIRFGVSAAGTNTFNGQGGARIGGGALASFIRIKEIAP